MNRELQVVVNRFAGGMDMVEVFVYERFADNVSLYNIDSKGDVVVTSMKKGTQNPKPFFRLPGYIWEDFVLTLTDELPNIKRDVVDAELKATKYHLEDMRDLVKKDKK